MVIFRLKSGRDIISFSFQGGVEFQYTEVSSAFTSWLTGAFDYFLATFEKEGLSLASSADILWLFTSRTPPVSHTPLDEPKKVCIRG